MGEVPYSKQLQKKGSVNPNPMFPPLSPLLISRLKKATGLRMDCEGYDR